MTSRFVSIRWPLLFAVVVGLPLPFAFDHVAAAGQEPTAIAVSAPASATLGEQVTVQARLGVASGPIAKATVLFAIPANFLDTSGDMVVGTGLTDGDGVASAQFEARMTGSLQVKAIFAGNDTYAASSATAPLSVSGSQQLYTPDVAIRLRGVTAAPIGPSSGAGHWLLSGWPIAALLIVVWSAYAVAVFFMSRISAEASRTVEASQ
jgi:hypothetical protein